MFEDLRAAFREAVKNFRDELNRDEIPEAVDRLVYGMKRETAEAKVRQHDLEDGIRRARAEAEREASEAETCRRREALARRIGDEETARIAGEYAAKHERRREVLEQKADALARELELRSGEIEEMTQQIREAERRRDTLSATAGRTQARESVRAGDGLFDELDRMADQMTSSDQERRAGDDLLDDLDRELDRDVYEGAEPSAAPDPRTDMDARLAELKRRMGQE